MSNTLRITLRAAIVSAIFVGPMIGLAAAKNEGANGMSGAGFVLYVSLSRP